MGDPHTFLGSGTIPSQCQTRAVRREVVLALEAAHAVFQARQVHHAAHLDLLGVDADALIVSVLVVVFGFALCSLHALLDLLQRLASPCPCPRSKLSFEPVLLVAQLELEHTNQGSLPRCQSCSTPSSSPSMHKTEISCALSPSSSDSSCSSDSFCPRC